jgi:hypothetical protein
MIRKLPVWKKKRFVKDVRGSIEGLPLQLMIMVLIAGLGSAVVIGWMGDIETPDTIGEVFAGTNEVLISDLDGDGLYDGEFDLTVAVMDGHGDPVDGASVLLDGCNVRSSEGGVPHCVTDADGVANFEGLNASRYGGSIGFIKVTASKSGYGTDDSLVIPVISG